MGAVSAHRVSSLKQGGLRLSREEAFGGEGGGFYAVSHLGSGSGTSLRLTVQEEGRDFLAGDLVPLGEYTN